MKPEKLCIWGDSIARGLMYDNENQKYTLCRDTFERALRAIGVSVRNYAKPGCTSDAALDIFKRSELTENSVAAIEFGGNDSDLVWSEVSEKPETEHAALVSLEKFKQNISNMVLGARNAGMRPVVVTPLPVVAERYFKWVSKQLNENAILKYLGSAQYIYRWQERYAYAAMEAARAVDCPIFDLRGLFLGRKDFADLMCIDGIHPNPAGYALISEAVTGAWQKIC